MGGAPQDDRDTAVDYVADAQNREVRVFDASGEHLRSFGRGGSGPGEFLRLYSLAWMGDTLLVLDPGNARVSLLTTTGDELGTWRSELTGGPTCDPAEPTRPPAQPVLHGIFFAHDGTLVAEAATPTGLVYDFFDDDGVLRMRAPAPTRDPEVAPFFRDGVVYVTALDSLDVPSVRSFRLDGWPDRMRR